MGEDKRRYCTLWLLPAAERMTHSVCAPRCRASYQPKVSLSRSNAWRLGWVWVLWEGDSGNNLSAHTLTEICIPTLSMTECFYLQRSSDQLKLDPEHKHYYQVQMQLSCCEVNYCDPCRYGYHSHTPKWGIFQSSPANSSCLLQEVHYTRTSDQKFAKPCESSHWNWNWVCDQ